jgi:DNA-binding MarR family transcriptional regulator
MISATDSVIEVSDVTEKNTNDVLTLSDQLQITATLLARYADRLFHTKTGISQAKYMVLSAIDYFKIPVNQNRIADRVQLNPNSFSMMADRLVKSGLVVRTRSGEDRRYTYLSLTPEGKELVSRGKKVNDSLEKHLLGLLGEKEGKGLQEALRSLERKIIHEKN